MVQEWELIEPRDILGEEKFGELFSEEVRAQKQNEKDDVMSLS
jgi:hypothetical protein